MRRMKTPSRVEGEVCVSNFVVDELFLMSFGKNLCCFDCRGRISTNDDGQYVDEF